MLSFKHLYVILHESRLGCGGQRRLELVLSSHPVGFMVQIQVVGHAVSLLTEAF